MKFNPKPIHENCKGCARIKQETSTCSAYEDPSYWWEPKPGVQLAPNKILYCPLATHVDMMPEEIKHKINPLKASKRAATGGKGSKKK